MNGSVFHIARITVEAETALSIASGQANGVFDTNLVMDANDLPAIPGSALAGVLRSLYRTEYDDLTTADKADNEQASNQLFGFQSTQKEGDDDSRPSGLNVSWGCIQNSQGKAIQGLFIGDDERQITNDVILKTAAKLTDSPVFRDRVKLNHKGVSANTGKFDRAVLPAGYRFTFELSMWSKEQEPQAWKNVLGLLKHPLFRLGGMTRAGLGKLKVVSAHQFTANLSTEEGRADFSTLSRDLNVLKGFSTIDIPEVNNSDAFVTAKISLKPNSYWRIGGDNIPYSENGSATQNEKPADLLPKFEEKVVWSESGNATGGAKKILIPASSVKGALSHRIAFHANRLNGVWAEEVLKASESDTNTDVYDKSENNDAVRTLFGYANSNKQGNSESIGQAGSVLIDDAYREFSAEKLQIIMHNSIDRFSGSVRDRMLFSEEMIWGEGVEIQLTIKKDLKLESQNKDDVFSDNKPANETERMDRVRQALAYALDDLCKGRLALGAGVSKGHGLFTGEVKWSDDEAWLKEGV